MLRTAHNPWLHAFAVFTATGTLGLIALGGLVTSHGAGLAVPDWPTTYGYNMFLFPISQWVGGIFYEHTHRLFASFVGLLTTILALWLWLKDSRRWLRWLGALAFLTVVAQGVLGGLRVTLFKDEIGIVHAALAQTFLLLATAIALFTSPWWYRISQDNDNYRLPPALSRLLVVTSSLIFLQLILGATMRHQHAGLAIPDFPLAYGRWWPPMNPDSIAAINAQRLDSRDFNPITASQIALHLAHRGLALAIAILVTLFAARTRRSSGPDTLLARSSLAWTCLIAIQILLGAATVWSNKAADVATAHVVTGALSLLLGTALSLITLRRPVGNPVEAATPSLHQTRIQNPNPALAD